MISALPGISALHVESNGENPHRAEVIGLGLSSPERHYFVPFALLQSHAAAPLRAWLGDSKAPKSGYDLHRADLALHWQGIPLPEQPMMCSLLRICWIRRKRIRT